MTDFYGFKGAAARLDDLDIPRIGHRIGVGEDELHAFMDVEAAGRGFDSQGRPKALFEPHKFYRHTSGSRRDAAIARGLAYPRWGMKPYPRDSYPRIEAAMEIDETAALKSTSWGLGQVLGENHAMLGYGSPQAMVLQFMVGEAVHLDGMVSFIIAADIDDDMRRLRAIALSGRPTRPEDCVPIVRVYNGPAYAKHDYHGRFARAHNRWRAIDDTPWTPDLESSTAPVVPEPGTDFPVLRRGAGMGSHVKLMPYVRRAQSALAAKGFYGGSIDGKFGPKTEQAVTGFQESRGLTPDGVIGNQQTWPALLA